MRIVVAHSHLNTFGGGERTVLELLRRLGARHEVELWAGDYQPHATYAELAQYPRRIMRAANWLYAVRRDTAVVANTFGANLLALRSPQTVCYIHSMRSIYAQGGRRPDLVARRALERSALHHARAVLTNSAFTAGRTAALHGVVPAVLVPGADDTLRALPPQAGTYALYVGRLAPEKGVERLLHWSADLPLDLVLAGTGEPHYLAHLRRIAGPRARFVGVQTGAALVALYAGARFLAFLPFAEELGLAALDAMAAATPVIASADGGLPELVRDGSNGYLVSQRGDFVRACMALIASDELTLALGRQARRDAATYTWDAFVERIEHLCEST